MIVWFGKTVKCVKYFLHIVFAICTNPACFTTACESGEVFILGHITANIAFDTESKIALEPFQHYIKLFSKNYVLLHLFKTGIITFGPGSALGNRFNDRKYQSKVELNKLVGERFKSIANKWGTRLDKAEKRARDELFTPAGGDRLDAANVMLIFTDGRPTGHKEKDFTPFKQLTDGLEVS